MAQWASMQVIPLPKGFDKLSKDQQIRYVQDLWDRISKRPDELPISDDALKIARERLAAYRRNPDRAPSAYDVVKRVPKKGN